MLSNKDDFKYFIEDDITFDDYIKDMNKDGTWGGNLEIQAMAMAFQANFYIHIYNHPMYIVKNFANPSRNVHLSYHDGEHYNSVRLKDDFENDIPVFIPLELIDCVEQTTNLQAINDKKNEFSNLSDSGESDDEVNNNSKATVDESAGDNNSQFMVAGITIRNIKLKNEKFQIFIMTKEGIILDDIKDTDKCHCKIGNKKYKNCCINNDIRGEYDKFNSIFYCDLETFKAKITIHKNEKLNSKTNDSTKIDIDSNVNSVIKQLDKIFI